MPAAQAVAKDTADCQPCKQPHEWMECQANPGCWLHAVSTITTVGHSYAPHNQQAPPFQGCGVHTIHGHMHAAVAAAARQQAEALINHAPLPMFAYRVSNHCSAESRGATKHNTPCTNNRATTTVTHSSNKQCTRHATRQQAH